MTRETGGVPHFEAGQRQLQSEVRPKELEYIRLRRRAVGLDEKSAETVGLALSGGGIRSATFNLGLLQALHRFGLLRHDWANTLFSGPRQPSDPPRQEQSEAVVMQTA